MTDFRHPGSWSHRGRRTTNKTTATTNHSKHYENPKP